MRIKVLLVLILSILSVKCFAERNIVIDKAYIISDTDIGNNVRLGGISDIICENEKVFYVITDRGPNGKIETPEGKFRTLISPDFKPRIFRLVLDDLVMRANVSESYYIQGQNGHCNGKPAFPNVFPWPNEHEVILDVNTHTPICPDVDGIDPEGLVKLDDNSFIITEEYGPSIIFNTFKPNEFYSLNRHYILPDRKDNRGLEAVALSEDNKHLWTCLQSSPVDSSFNIPFIIYDIETREIIKEINYRLEEDTRDGKICAMSRLDKDHVVVLEQSDTTNAKLFKFNVNDRTKTLFASMDKILPQIAKDITNKNEKTTGLKLEGFCFIDDFTIAMVNDNDFSLDPEEPRKSCLWILKLSNEF